MAGFLSHDGKFNDFLQEIQQLRQQIVQVEQQLRTVLSPTYLPNDREKALQEQQVGLFILLKLPTYFFSIFITCIVRYRAAIDLYI